MLDRLVDPNIVANGCTGLHMAPGRQARLGDVKLMELVTLLLDSHSDPNILDNQGSSPLSPAMRARILESTRYDIVDELCKGRTEVNARDGSTYTSLHMAAYYGRTSVVARLIEFGADLNHQAPPLPGRGWSHVMNTETPGGLDRKQLFTSPPDADTYTQQTQLYQCYQFAMARCFGGFADALHQIFAH
eukprot:Skav211961  [mRNA]  locus=scaffold433:140989:142574:+ [translate_table: standard]